MNNQLQKDDLQGAKAIETGGPAFPTGMTILDYFAAQDHRISLEDIRDHFGWPKDLPIENERLSSFPKGEPVDNVRRRWELLNFDSRAQVLAEMSYRIAFAMLAARAKIGGEE